MMFTRIFSTLIFTSSALVSSSSFAASEAEIAFNKEVLECAAYYQIASDAIVNMNAPQMVAVGDRLKKSAQDAVSLAKNYQSEEEVNNLLEQTVAKHEAELPESKNLGGLMGRYKEPCQNLLANPQQRMDYWIMATM